MEEPKYIVVVGASAGGLQAVIELMAQLTTTVDAAFLVVLHSSSFANGDVVMQRLQKHTDFRCKMAEHNEPIRSRHIYLAVPDYHLIVKKDKIILGRGPVENRWRPSIDVLFRSAAVSFNSRVIGIVLTGLLEDGASGMHTIKSCGGTCMVQDPKEAEYPDMPQAVLRLVEVDYCATLEEIAIILKEKTADGAPEPHPIPPHILKEAEIAERVALGIETVQALGGERSAYSCPACGGALWEINEGTITRYRCPTGHMYTAAELQESKRKELENTFWVALRIMEERRNLLNKVAQEERSKGWTKSANSKKERADELEGHIGRIKEILFHATDDPGLTGESLPGI